MTKDELILKHFRKPKGYTKVTDKEWKEHLEHSLMFGCDWLEIMQDMNPMPGEAVEDMAERLEELEAKNE